MKNILLLLIIGLLFSISSFAFFVLSSSSLNFQSSSIITTTTTSSTSSTTTPIDKEKSMINKLRGGIVTKMSSFSSSSSVTAAIPSILYGTAWKKDRTTELVELAIRTGFRGIDTACQPRHYNEPGVGLAVKKLIDEGFIKRSDLFLQTKYTPIGGQDPNNIPYDPSQPIEIQVEQSFQKSLSNLHTDYLDSLILHSPLAKISDTLKVWKKFEEIYKNNGVKRIGISNCYDLNLFKKIVENSEIKPSFLQNRFYKDTDYDVDLRKYCQENNVIYQSFWTLTANPHIVHSKIVQSIAGKLNKTPEQVFFAFVRSMNILFLSGTKDVNHMKEDLDVKNITLDQQDIDNILKLL